MTNVPVSEDLCWAIVRMSSVLTVDYIVAFTAVSRSKIYQIIELHRRTGQVLIKRDSRMLGRPRLLTLEQVHACFHFQLCPFNVG